MRKVRFLLYKAGIDGKAVDNGISFWTGLINLPKVIWQERTWNLKKWGKAVWDFIKRAYSHTEIWKPNKKGMFITLPESLATKPLKKWFKSNVCAGTCYTSTMGQARNKNAPPEDGTVKRPAAGVLKHPKRWDYVEVDLEDEDFDRLIYWMDLEVENNLGYGKRDTLNFFGLGFLADKLRNICSEFNHNGVVVAMIKGFIAPICGSIHPPVTFDVWPMPAQIAHLSMFFKVVSPRIFARMLIKAGYEIKSLSNG